MDVPWTIAEMSLEQAEAAYRSYRSRRNPSTADMRREADLARHIARLDAEQRNAGPIAIAEAVAQMRVEIAARKGVR